MHVLIDGDRTNGVYHVACTCSATWTGTAPSAKAGYWSPALPIAEAVAHRGLEHQDEEIVVDFTPQFRGWLGQYWELMSWIFRPTHESRGPCPRCHEFHR
jgi:hypothetical protein